MLKKRGINNKSIEEVKRNNITKSIKAGDEEKKERKQVKTPSKNIDFNPTVPIITLI